MKLRALCNIWVENEFTAVDDTFELNDLSQIKRLIADGSCESLDEDFNNSDDEKSTKRTRK